MDAGHFHGNYVIIFHSVHFLRMAAKASWEHINYSDAAGLRRCGRFNFNPNYNFKAFSALSDLCESKYCAC